MSPLPSSFEIEKGRNTCPPSVCEPEAVFTDFVSILGDRSAAFVQRRLNSGTSCI